MKIESILDKSENLSNLIAEKLITDSQADLFVNKHLALFLQQHPKFISTYQNIDSYQKNKDFIGECLNATSLYHDGKLLLKSLTDKRCEAWRLHDKSINEIKLVLHLVIMTMYDSEKERHEIDIYESLVIILNDLNEINPILIEEFESYLVDAVAITGR